MAIGGVITNNGRVNAIDRAYLDSPTYSVPYQFRVGIGSTTPNISDTDLEIPIPISVGTSIDGGDNNFTGSSGGDNSTNNVSTYKEGAGQTDDTAQNLIANDTSVSKIWTITLGVYPDNAKYTGLWLYIKDSTALDKFEIAGTVLEIKIGSDNSNYYSKTYEDSDLSTGWNWLPLGILNELSETGTVTGDIDTFIIEITTNNADDEFAEGDIVYDLLRQWEQSDTFKTFITGYPTIDEPNIRAVIQASITTIEANGFLITELGVYNNDTTPLLLTRDVINPISKSNTDELKIIHKDQMREHS